MTDIEHALETVRAAGYVAIKATSYRNAQERQRIAQVQRQCAEEDAERARNWARDCLERERETRDRVTEIWTLAQAHGATIDDLRELNRKTSQEETP